MERFITWTIRIWISIHLAFTLTELAHTYLLVDDEPAAMDRTMSLLDYMSQFNRAAPVVEQTEDNSAGDPQTETSTPASFQNSFDFFRNDDGTFKSSEFTHAEDETGDTVNAIQNIVCRITYLTRVMNTVYSLFTLRYPFMDAIETEVTGPQGTDIGLLILYFLYACQVFASVSGVLLTMYLAVAVFRSGIIGSFISTVTSGATGLTISGAIAALIAGGAPILHWLTQVFGC